MSDNPDTLIWKYEAKGLYTVKSFYKIINFRGVLPGNIPVVWRIKIPPRIQIFLWLLDKNKLLTRDNLHKRQNVPDRTCLFCSDPESACHLFFECVVAAELWRVVGELIGSASITNMTVLLDHWEHSPNAAGVIVQAAALWALWKCRNDICFNRVFWSGIQVIVRKTASILTLWEVLWPDAVKVELEECVRRLEQTARDPPLILWPDPG